MENELRLNEERLILQRLFDAKSVFVTDSAEIDDALWKQLKFVHSQPSLLEKPKEGRRVHFELNSGRHTGVLFQLSVALQYAHISQMIAFRLHKLLSEAKLLKEIDVLVGPAMGALPVIYALHHVINSPDVKAMYVERDASGKFVLGRGFKINEDERVLVIDDVFTTGGSIMRTMQALPVEDHVVGAAVILDRSSHGMLPAQLRMTSIPYIAALHYPSQDWDPRECPYCPRGYLLAKI